MFSLLYLLLVASCKIGQFPCCHLDNLFVFEEIIEDRYIIYQSKYRLLKILLYNQISVVIICNMSLSPSLPRDSYFLPPPSPPFLLLQFPCPFFPPPLLLKISYPYALHPGHPRTPPFLHFLKHGHPTTQAGVDLFRQFRIIIWIIHDFLKLNKKEN